VNLIVDAVDECVGLSTFMGGLNYLIKGSNIKLLLTSRHDVELQRTIEPIADFQISVAEFMWDDIEIYLAAEVTRRISIGLLKFREKNLDSIIVEALKNKAHGM
jgi:hypothetical protein